VAQGPASDRGDEGRRRDDHEGGRARPPDEREQPSPARGEGQRGAAGGGPDAALAVPQHAGQQRGGGEVRAQHDVGREHRGVIGPRRRPQHGVHDLLPRQLRGGDRGPAQLPAGEQPRRADQERGGDGQGRDRHRRTADGVRARPGRGHGCGQHGGARQPVRRGTHLRAPRGT
jgi:hypothetical protein